MLKKKTTEYAEELNARILAQIGRFFLNAQFLRNMALNIRNARRCWIMLWVLTIMVFCILFLSLNWWGWDFFLFVVCNWLINIMMSRVWEGMMVENDTSY